MLYFARKPDLVFTAILHTALESEGESHQRLDQQRSRFMGSLLSGELKVFYCCYLLGRLDSVVLRESRPYRLLSNRLPLVAALRGVAEFLCDTQ